MLETENEIMQFYDFTEINPSVSENETRQRYVVDTETMTSAYTFQHFYKPISRLITKEEKTDERF